MTKQNQIEIPEYALEGNKNIPEDLNEIIALNLILINYIFSFEIL